MLSSRITLLQDLNVQAGLHEPCRAVLGDGSAARRVVLDFLPLRTGLLRLRAVSQAARQLVFEHRIIIENQVCGDDADPNQLDKFEAFRRAFRRLHIRADASNSEWLGAVILADERNNTTFRTSHTRLFRSSVQPIEFCFIALMLRTRDMATIQASDSSRAALRRAQELFICNAEDRLRGRLPELCAVVTAACSLRRLHLTCLSAAQVTHEDLLPLAHTLQHLSLTQCPGIRHFQAFARLTMLDCDYGPSPVLLDPHHLPISLYSLRLRCVRLACPWSALRFMGQLKELHLSQCEGVSAACLAQLPSSVTSLSADMLGSCPPGARALLLSSLAAQLHTLDVSEDHHGQGSVAACMAEMDWPHLCCLKISARDACCLPPLPALQSLTLTLLPLHAEDGTEEGEDSVGEVALPCMHWVLTGTPALQCLLLERIYLCPADMTTLVISHPNLRQVQFHLPSSDPSQHALQGLLCDVFARLLARHGKHLRAWVRCHLPLRAKQTAEDADMGRGWHAITHDRLARGAYRAAENDDTTSLMRHWGMPSQDEEADDEVTLVWTVPAS